MISSLTPLIRTVACVAGLLCGASSLVRAADGGDVDVDYDFTVRRHLGGKSTLEREKYFNIHTSASYGVLSKEDLKFLRDDLGVRFGRAFNGPFWYFPAKNSLETPFPSEEQAAAMSRAITDLYETQITYPQRDRRLIITDHPAETFDMKLDLEAAAQWAVTYFRHFFNDSSRPLFYEPMNEPFVHTKHFGDDDEAVRTRMAEMYREIGMAFDESGMPVQVIGYASAWPSMELNDFGHWNTRMKMFMDVAGEYMDGFSTHLYDGTNVTGQDNRRSGANADAILDLIETYSFIKWGKAKPHAITEYGDIPKGYPQGYTEEKSSQELRAYNHLLFGLMERQDRLLTSVPFITSKSPWHIEESGRVEPYLADLWGPVPDSVVDGVAQEYFLTKKLLFYQLWEGVRGERTVARSSDPDLQARAFVDGATAFLCLNNLADEPRTVKLNQAGSPGELEAVSIRRLDVPPREAARYSEETLDPAPTSLTLEPYETIVLRYEYRQPVVFGRELDVETHYSKTHLQPIKAGQPIRFQFEGVPANAERASLRMGIGRKPDRSRQPTVKVNGRPVEVPDNWPGYDQGNRKDFFGAIPIPLPDGSLEETTTVELTFPDEGGRVSSLLLLTETPRQP